MNPKSIIRDLQRRDEHLREKEAELLEDLAEVQRQRAALAAVMEMIEKDDSGDSGDVDQPVKEVRNAMVEVLREAGHPIYYKDFHAALAARHVTVKGKDPSKTISAHLSNDDRFVKVGRGWWALSSWPRERREIPRARVEHDGGGASREWGEVFGDPVEETPVTAEPTRPPVPLFPAASNRRVVNGFEPRASYDPDADDLDDVPF